MRLYEQDAWGDAAAAFAKVTALRPKEGTAWAMLGLCEYRLGRHDAALAHIEQARALGTSGDPQFQQVLLYHHGMLLAMKDEFERAQEVLDSLAASGAESDETIVALGLTVLRVRPSDLESAPGDLRDAVRRAGQGEQLAARGQAADALREYEALAAAHPSIRNVQYALGRHFVARREPERAAEAYLRELARFPDHVPARLGVAAVKATSAPQVALRYAEEAVRLDPRVPLGHFLLGSLLLRTNDTARAIAELEIAEQAVKQDPRLYYALSRAYARAGRTADAERARATFLRLNDEQQRAARRDP